MRLDNSHAIQNIDKEYQSVVEGVKNTVKHLGENLQDWSVVKFSTPHNYEISNTFSHSNLHYLATLDLRWFGKTLNDMRVRTLSEGLENKELLSKGFVISENIAKYFEIKILFGLIEDESIKMRNLKLWKENGYEEVKSSQRFLYENLRGVMFRDWNGSVDMVKII